MRRLQSGLSRFASAFSTTLESAFQLRFWAAAGEEYLSMEIVNSDIL